MLSLLKQKGSLVASAYENANIHDFFIPTGSWSVAVNQILTTYRKTAKDNCLPKPQVQESWVKYLVRAATAAEKLFYELHIWTKIPVELHEKVKITFSSIRFSPNFPVVKTRAEVYVKSKQFKVY